MSSIKSIYSDIDYPILGAALGLIVIGILSIYSSGMTSEGIQVSNEYLKQIIWAVSGLILMGLTLLLDHKRMKDYSLFVYLFFLLVLIYTSFAGKVVNGSRSWIGIGDIGIQPSEFTKLATILFLAQYLSNTEHVASLKRLASSFAIVSIPVLVILPQQDFGTSLVFFPIFIFSVYAAGIERRHIAFLLSGAFLSGLLTILPLWEKFILKSPPPLLFVFYRQPFSFFSMGIAALIFCLAVWGWNSFKKRYYYWIGYASLLLAGGILVSSLAQKILKDYQIMRLIVFLDPSIDPRGSGWNILQSVTAIGSGGFFGKGFLQGTQSHYRYLPQQSTDFIFSIIAEEWGFLGGLAVFGLFTLLFRRCILLIKSSKDVYATTLVAGILGMVFFHFFINAGMAMGIMPITGIPLFFLSYGGSSLWTILIAVGLLLGISARRYGA
jgi:rod shape determining protein RodA